jgi:cytochrome c-type biogenesis protein CcmH/NrfG
VNLLTLPFRLPFLPARSLIRLAEIIRDEAERQYHDPVAIRRELEEVERAVASGQISDEEAALREREIIGRLTRPKAPASEAAASGEEA